MERLKFNIKRRDLVLALIGLVSGLILGGILFGIPGKGTEANITADTASAQEEVWTCSMHPQIRQSEPGTCPICAMDLVPVSIVYDGSGDADPGSIHMSESAMRLADIQTAKVKRGKPQKSIHLLGRAEPDEGNIAEITARFGGRIEKLYINFVGQTVKKGEILGSIYSPELISAQRELLEAVEFKTSNPSFYRATRGKLRLWNLSEEQIDALENRSEPTLSFDIHSAISGTVTKRLVTTGDYIKAGTPLLEVMDLTRIWIMFDAYERDLPWIKQGDRVQFSLEAIPGTSFSGAVRHIDPFIDSRTRIAQVRVEVQNPQLSIKPGMFANGTLISSSAFRTPQIIVPKSAVLWTGKRSLVYVKEQHENGPSFSIREVVMGPEASDQYIIKEGLSEGEEIAVNGVFKIDAAAQLSGKPSMMNPKGGMTTAGHDHGGMAMTDAAAQDHGSAAAYNQHTSFRVSGACSMCETRIEDTVNDLDGVRSASWDMKSQMLHVDFDAGKITILEIHRAVAKAGHDTELFKASDSVYKSLPACCKYREL